MSRPRRKERELLQIRATIVEAAARLFARHGFRATTMAAIADEVGYSSPTLYSYFKGKKAILGALVAQLTEQFSTLFDVTFPRGLTLAQQLEMLCRHQDAWAERNRDAFIFFNRGEVPVDAGGDRSKLVFGQYIAGQIAWFKEHAAPGELGDATPEEAAWILWGMRHGMFQRWLNSDELTSLADGAPRVIDLFFNGVLGRRDAE